MDIDIETETKKIGSSPLIKYGLLAIGLVIFFFSQGILNWKSTSARDASGKVDAIQLEISKLDKELTKSEDTDKKKEMREEIKDLRENDLNEARMNAVGEEVDSKNGVWFWSMVNHLGGAVIALGLLVITVTGCPHEKIGSLVALGILIAST
jgi:hypothetical protein